MEEKMCSFYIAKALYALEQCCLDMGDSLDEYNEELAKEANIELNDGDDAIKARQILLGKGDSNYLSSVITYLLDNDEALIGNYNDAYCQFLEIQPWLKDEHPDELECLHPLLNRMEKVNSARILLAYRVGHEWWKYLDNMFGVKTNSYFHVGHKTCEDEEFARYGEYVCGCEVSYKQTGYLVGFAADTDKPFATIYKVYYEVNGRTYGINHERSEAIKTLEWFKWPEYGNAVDFAKKLAAEVKNAENDSSLEEKWDELSDVPFDEDESGALILADNWDLFSKGTNRDEIWKWFDENHSKGVHWLLYER